MNPYKALPKARLEKRINNAAMRAYRRHGGRERQAEKTFNRTFDSMWLAMRIATSPPGTPLPPSTIAAWNEAQITRTYLGLPPLDLEFTAWPDLDLDTLLIGTVNEI